MRNQADIETDRIHQPTGAPPTEAPPPPPEPSLAELKEQLAQTQAQAAEYLDNWRRSVAEMNNARKRMQREQAEFNANATARVLQKLIPLADDVERAFDVLSPDQAHNDWIKGFCLIQRKLQAFFESEGVTSIPAEGQMFDPALHHAVSHEEAEGFAEGQIIAEVARGYRLGEKVLRPSVVRVAKSSEPGK